MKKCKHQHCIWKMQHEYCVNCNEKTAYKDMNKIVILPNIKASK